MVIKHDYLVCFTTPINSSVPQYEYIVVVCDVGINTSK